MEESIQEFGVIRLQKRKSESDFPDRGKKFPPKFWTLKIF